MTEDELLALIKSRTDDARSNMTEIRAEREQSLNYYHQEKYGNEREGYSSFVTSEVRDTIEWLMPQLVEMFIGGDNPVVFAPQTADDKDAAKQESDYVRYVYNRQNNGFLNTYTWFKDALLQKNGIVKCYWDDDETKTVEEYENQNIIELVTLAQDEGLEFKSIIATLPDGTTTKVKNPEKLNEAYADNLEDLMVASFDVKSIRIESNSQVVIEPVAPENFYIDPTYKSIDLCDCNFVREDIRVTKSDLRQMGFDEKKIKDIPHAGGDFKDSEHATRFKKEGGLNRAFTNKETEDEREIILSDVYVRVDKDGDGISELRLIKLGGDTVILSDEEVDKIPYFAITPIINTHKFFGMSVADIVADLQLLHSTIMRQTLDSLYLSNNPRHAVLRGHVEIDDLISSQVGGIVREDVPNAVRPLTIPFVGRDTIPMMDVVKDMTEIRTGISATTQGLNPEVLSDSTNMVGAMIMSAAQGRIKMIARIFAEVGFKPLMLYVHELVLKHEENEKIAELSGEFVTVNPTEWKTRKDMKVKVGIGHSEKKEQIVSIERVLNAQEKIYAAQGGEGAIVNAQNVYNALNDLLELMDMNTQGRYFSNPKDYTPPPQENISSEALDIAEAELTAKTVKESNEFKLKVETERFSAYKGLQEIAIKKAELLQKADSEDKRRRIDALFKAAEMEEREVDKRLEAANVQNEQTTTGNVNASTGIT